VHRSLVVVAHPRPGSFCHALAEAATGALVDAGHDLAVHDLYAEGFDPVLRPEEALTTGGSGDAAFTVGADPLVTRHRRTLAAAHTLVVAHPNWWGKPPAILAGWMDRVLVPGVVYRLAAADGEPECLLPLRRLVVLNTGDTPPEREAAVFGDPLDAVWRRCVGGYLGDAAVERLLATPVGAASDRQRRGWLAQARALAVPG
jgi:NAD(P)H dehydrogenase (quinone)